MKYIELYLNKRQEELEKEKAEHIERFKKEYQTTSDMEDLLENVVCDYYIMIDSLNMRIDEIKKLRKDLILDKENEE